MKTRLLTGLCLICLLINLLPLSVSATATSGSCGDNATWSLNSSGVLTISGTGAIRNYIYAGANLWPNIEAPWREYYSHFVKEIIISPGITSIGKNAFCCLPNVTTVSIPNTVTFIGQAAFCENTSLNNVVIPNSVVTIEQSAFKYCRSLTSIVLPSSLTTLGGQAFYCCDKLNSVTLSPNLSVINHKTFALCESLLSITLPEGITSIDDNAFWNSSVKKINLPSTLEKIGWDAFRNNKLTEITIPASVKEIQRDAFYGNTDLKRVYFMGDAPSIGEDIFEYVTATVYYPKDNPTWTEEVRQNYSGTITWVAYCGGGHTWGQWSTKRPATCSKAGLKTRACTQCDMTEDASIAKTPHQYISVVTPPTCSDDGFTTHTCKVCSSTYTDNEVPAGPHAFGEWAILKEATCMEKGSRQHSCTVCDAQETEEIPLSSHSYRDEVTDPSCTQKGFTTHICTVCEHTFVDTYTQITEHTYGEWTEVKPATWWEEGIQFRKCADCVEEQTQVLPKLPVNWVLVVGMIAGVVVAVVVLTKKRRI